MTTQTPGITRLRLAPNQPPIELRSPDGTPRLRVASPEPGHISIEVLGEQHFYGLGQGGQPFDRLGQHRRFWNNHVNHGQGGDIAIPLLLSHTGIGLYFDTSSPAWIDAGDSYDLTWIAFTCAGPTPDICFLAADTLRETMALVRAHLGAAPMPPRWALGYIQSTRHFANAEEAATLATEFRTRALPLDAIAFLSSYGTALGWNQGVGSLDFEPGIIPDPAALFAALHAAHVKIMLHEYPVLAPTSPLHAEAAARNALLDIAYPDSATQPAANYHQGQRYIDFATPETADWWWNQHRPLLELGVDAWWLDGGEGPFPTPDSPARLTGEHNRYDLARQAAFAAGEARDRPNRRPFLLCRSGGPGMQTHAAAAWSGDVNGTFATLAAQIPTGLNLGLSGVPWWGTDIGGYYPTLPDTKELFIRWFQFGAFCPIFRAHGRTWRNHLPWSHGAEAEAICRRYLELRSRLAPYNYTLAWQAHRTGLPMMRPMVLNYPGDPRFHDAGHQYLWGDDLLVAPVTQPGATHWPVTLPHGEWHDFWTHQTHQGGAAITVESPLDRLPLFIRAGAIIPMGPTRQHLDDPTPPPLTVLIYPAKTSAFTLYEDDGISRDHERGQFQLTHFTCIATDRNITIELHAGTPTTRDCTWRIRMNPPRHADAPWHAEDGFVVIATTHIPARIVMSI